jgi:predicted phosphodiesterase
MNDHFVNRRQTLAAGVATTASLCSTYRLPAAEDVKPLSFIIVTDTHLGRNDNASAEKNWRRAIEEINQQAGDFVLHLGDVVDSGREAQYPLYVETRKLLNKPIHEIGGNHDPADLFSKYVVDKPDRSVDYGGVRFVLFNNAHEDSHLGFITSEQNAWVAEQCDEAAGKNLKVVICCHVPIHANKHPDRGWYVKPTDGQKEFYETQRRHADRIVAFFHGHFHNGIRGWRDHGQTVEVLCPSVCYNQNRGLKDHIAGGKATGFFVDELRPGYVLAEVGNGKLTLRYKPLWDDVHGEYVAEYVEEKLPK